jgi:hypothetical protein
VEMVGAGRPEGSYKRTLNRNQCSSVILTQSPLDPLINQTLMRAPTSEPVSGRYMGTVIALSMPT